MPVPVVLPTTAREGSYAGLTYHIEGELVPALHIELAGVPVYFEHHVLFWKDTSVSITAKPLEHAFTRNLAAMPIFMANAEGQGRIAFSRDGPGHIVSIHLEAGQSIDVREHQFLAATSSLNFSFNRVKGVANMLLGGTGFFIDTFTAGDEAGVLWLHGYGNVFHVALAPGEQIDVEPGGWIYKDPSVQLETIVQRISTALISAPGRIVLNRFTGPGRLGLQSMQLHLIVPE